MPIRTHYENLQVTRNADASVIKSAYKSLIQKHHPDRCAGDKTEAERITKILNDAYQTLSDPESRKLHDDWIAEQEAYEKEKRAEINMGFENKIQTEDTGVKADNTAEESLLQAIRRSINRIHQRNFKPIEISRLQILIYGSAFFQLLAQGQYSGPIHGVYKHRPDDIYLVFFYNLESFLSLVFTVDYWLSTFAVFCFFASITTITMMMLSSLIHDKEKILSLHYKVIVWSMFASFIPYLIFRTFHF